MFVDPDLKSVSIPMLLLDGDGDGDGNIDATDPFEWFAPWLPFFPQEYLPSYYDGRGGA